jgi:hypothetical protein
MTLRKKSRLAHRLARVLFRGVSGFLLTVIVAGSAFAAGGGKPATKIYNVADTRGMHSGLSKWIADIYNSDLLLFGLLVVGVMALMGLTIGRTMDFLVSRLGIDLGRLEHHE